MNTNQKTQNTAAETPKEIPSFLPDTDNAVAKQEDSPIIHEAKIITPQPYGVFALCKIFEQLQIN
jgi:hypothetical protein